MKLGWTDVLKQVTATCILIFYLKFSLALAQQFTEELVYMPENTGTEICTCDNGTPENTCSTIQALQADCQSCDPGYTLISYTDIIIFSRQGTMEIKYATKFCKMTVDLSDCKCDNGVPKKHCYGSELDMELCDSCNDGFVLEMGELGGEQNTNLVNTYYTKERCVADSRSDDYEGPPPDYSGDYLYNILYGSGDYHYSSGDYTYPAEFTTVITTIDATDSTSTNTADETTVTTVLPALPSTAELSTATESISSTIAVSSSVTGTSTF